MSLPGTPRDLPTMEAHLERAYVNSVELWKYDDMHLRVVAPHGTWREHRVTLQEVRMDMAAMRSCIDAMRKALETIADSNTMSPDVGAYQLQEIARQAVGVRNKTNDLS